MGIRMDQPQGISPEAEDFLRKNVLMTGCEPCPHCKKFTKEQIVKVKSGEKVFGMYNNEYDLYRYTLTNGGFAYEKSQCAPWSSGPVIFLKLIVKSSKGKKKKEFIWSAKEIESLV